ncbi:siderophore-interacting protein [Microbacterium sediminicola]|uniref:Siderophore-interacting protein n=1 Tax=Microbacterium sediminicola TaxID=415210 RepID=A0ABP4U7S8_9MICO
MQRVFEVVRTERVAPQLVRVHLGGDAFDGFVENAGPEKLALADKYVKFLFARPELELEPPYDLDALRARLDPADMPVRRTYTVRAVDHEAKTIAVDFVVHGDAGLAGPWAASAQPGDRVALSGPGAKYTPASGDVFHLLVVDDAAIPAVAVALETMSADARGVALIEVADADAHVELTAPAGVEVRWLHREGAGYGEPLVTAVLALPQPEGEVDVFAHGEREAIKRIGAHLHESWGIERPAMSLSAYWAFGRSEDAFQAEKRSPAGQIFAD